MENPIKTLETNLNKDFAELSNYLTFKKPIKELSNYIDFLIFELVSGQYASAEIMINKMEREKFDLKVIPNGNKAKIMVSSVTSYEIDYLGGKDELINEINQSTYIRSITKTNDDVKVTVKGNNKYNVEIHVDLMDLLLDFFITISKKLVSDLAKNGIAVKDNINGNTLQLILK